MKQPWHTEGYSKLASASMYLNLREQAGLITYAEAHAATKVLLDAGKKIRKSVECNAARQARHEAMTSCGLERVRVNGKVFYE